MVQWPVTVHLGPTLVPAAGLCNCIWMSRTPVESVESRCKATHQVLAQVCGHFFIYFFIVVYENEIIIFANDSVSASQTVIQLLVPPQTSHIEGYTFFRPKRCHSLLPTQLLLCCEDESYKVEVYFH